MHRPWSPRCAFVCAAMALITCGGRVDAQEHDGQYEQADIEYGLVVYRAECTTCHGDNGDGVPNVDLRSGRLRQAATDRELRRVIRAGIPGTAMPPFSLDPAESVGIVAYLRNMSFETDAVALGDKERGRILFAGKGECATCHRVNGTGPRFAPELTTIGAARAPSALQRSLLDPSGSMRPIKIRIRLRVSMRSRIRP